VLKDVERRNRNIVVSGLAEDDNLSDSAAFLQLCENYLHCKPLVIKCFRLGHRMEDRPRHLMIRLRDENTATELLKSARLLREANNPAVARKVYLNPGLARAAAKIAFEERQMRRQIRSAQRLEHSNNTNRTTVSITNIQNSRDPDCDHDHVNATTSNTQPNTVLKTIWASQAVVTHSPTVVQNCDSLPSHSSSSPRATQGVDRSNDAVESTTDANSLTTELYPPSLDPCAPPFRVGQRCTRPRAR